jgi:hypothetical protein
MKIYTKQQFWEFWDFQFIKQLHAPQNFRWNTPSRRLADVVESKKIPRLSRQKSAAELQKIGIESRRRKSIDLIDLGLWVGNTLKELEYLYFKVGAEVATQRWWYRSCGHGQASQNFSYRFWGKESTIETDLRQIVVHHICILLMLVFLG